MWQQNQHQVYLKLSLFPQAADSAQAGSCDTCPVRSPIIKTRIGLMEYTLWATWKTGKGSDRRQKDRPVCTLCWKYCLLWSLDFKFLKAKWNHLVEMIVKCVLVLLLWIDFHCGLPNCQLLLVMYILHSSIQFTI